jgi:L-asparaginase
MTTNDRRALVLALGGTISMTGMQGRDVSPRLGSRDVVAGLGEGIIVEPRDVRTVPGAHLSFADVLGLTETIRTAADDDYAGMVITQGTDSIEETAFALDLLVGNDITVVVTGAMRNASAAGADGPANVSDALAVAVDPQCRGIGTLVVLNGEIHAAGLVRKAHTVAPSAFESHPGALGWVSEGMPNILLVPGARRSIPRVEPPWQTIPRVDLVTATADADASMLDHLLDDLPNGLVVKVSAPVTLRRLHTRR